MYDRSRDMWDVGVLFAQVSVTIYCQRVCFDDKFLRHQMLFGLDVAQRYSSPSELICGSASLDT